MTNFRIFLRGSTKLIKILFLLSVNQDGFTPLDVAVLTNAVDVAKMLLQHGAKQNPKSKFCL